MAASKYPQKLDTSVEIPPVRDNILEIGSDVINSLRSAIFNIERTLGLNPQGATGKTLAERLDTALDRNGNIKSAALDRANVLSGPIVDADVSEVAAIKESKIKLDFPTTLLQDEISILNKSIDSILSQVEEISVSLSAHLHANSTNRHPATAISTASKASVASDTAIVSLPTGNVQTAFEAIINQHINYTGSGISSSNRSHEADQIYFNNSEVDEILDSVDVQGAIEELANASSGTEISHQDYFHSNGLLRLSKQESASNPGLGKVLAEEIDVIFSKSSGLASGLTTITLNDPISVGDFDLGKGDLLTISDVNDTTLDIAGTYEINSIVIDDGEVESIEIFGLMPSASTSLTLGTISKHTKLLTNSASLLCVAREEADLTSARTIQICNPDSAKIITRGIIPSEITTSNRYIELTYDDQSSVVLDLYDGNSERQSLDTIVSKINEQCAENAYDFLAYRIDLEDGQSELIIACNLPDSIDETHTLKVGRGSDNALDSIGFGYLEDIEVSATIGSTYYIQGRAWDGLASKLDSTKLSFSAGAVTVTSSGSDLDFLELGIRARRFVNYYRGYRK